MIQQSAIILMIDTEAALKDNTLEGNIYMFDNMKTRGSEGEGTGALVTAVNGSHWHDDTMAEAQGLNWLAYAIGTVPPTLPKGFQVAQSRIHDKKAIEELKSKKGLKVEDTSVISQLRDNQGNVKSTHLKMVDITGQTVTKEYKSDLYMTPIIKEISGEAVERGILYPDQHGSPDYANNGWYWASSVVTNKSPGVYAYTLHLILYHLSKEDDTWMPVEMTYNSYINVTSEAKINGFTEGAMGMLPIYPATQ
ncbi:MAG: hypothetical protein HRU20_15820 [Pseudomonadales bacterium]|nr:hypothetical protein [Pseudomonadales bacterium]